MYLCIYLRKNFTSINICLTFRITFLSEIRNDDSHRCEVISFDKDKVIKDYENIKINGRNSD